MHLLASLFYRVQWCAGHYGTVHVNLAPYISAIFQPKWLKFGLQSHFSKMFGHIKFQLSITCTFRVIKLLVEITKYLHFKFDNFESTRDRELKICVSKHLEKMCLETKFQPFLLRNDEDIECPT